MHADGGLNGWGQAMQNSLTMTDPSVDSASPEPDSQTLSHDSSSKNKEQNDGSFSPKLHVERIDDEDFIVVDLDEKQQKQQNLSHTTNNNSSNQQDSNHKANTADSNQEHSISSTKADNHQAPIHLDDTLSSDSTTDTDTLTFSSANDSPLIIRHQPMTPPTAGNPSSNDQHHPKPRRLFTVLNDEDEQLTSPKEQMPSYLKYRDQDVNSLEWKSHKKHIFILSRAGKPIFSRYGDESDLNTKMGFFTVVVGHVSQHANDEIQYLEYEDFRVVFKLRDEIILVAMVRGDGPTANSDMIHYNPDDLTIGDMNFRCQMHNHCHDGAGNDSTATQLLSASSSGSSVSIETPAELQLQLDAIYSQIEFFVTSGLQKQLRHQQSFDVRNVLGGTDAILHNLISTLSRSLNYSWDAYRPLRMKARTRSQIADLMMRYKPDSLCYALLLSRGQLIHILRSRKWSLHASDLLLLLNFVKSNTSLRTSDSWTPVCLPKVKNDGYLFAYISFLDLDSDLCLLYVCSKSTEFPNCAQAKELLMKNLQHRNNKLLNSIRQACNRPHFSTVEVKLFPNVRHFVYLNHSCNQLVEARYILPYNRISQKKRLIREYKKLRETLNTQSSTSQPEYFQTTDHESILAYQTPQYELYATFSLLISKLDAVKYANALKDFVKRHEDSLFLSVGTC